MDAVFFFMDGMIDVGYEINRFIKYKLRLTCPLIIGGLECCLNRRSQ